MGRAKSCPQIMAFTMGNASFAPAPRPTGEFSGADAAAAAVRMCLDALEQKRGASHSPAEHRFHRRATKCLSAQLHRRAL